MHKGYVQMKSAKFSYFLNPLVRIKEPIYTIKLMQPPLLRLLFGDPLPLPSLIRQSLLGTCLGIFLTNWTYVSWERENLEMMLAMQQVKLCKQPHAQV